MRNLGFEDTPDYDYLRDLFTQALKSTGELEDGEYDWMKLNNGKGWEAMKQHPSQHHLHQANAVPNSSQRDLHGGTARGHSQGQLTTARLNAAQPPPPSPAKPGVGKTRERQSAPGAMPPKRQSGAAGGASEVKTPTVSTQAQFQNSNSHLPPRMNSQPNAGPNAATHPNQRVGVEPTPTTWQKMMGACCCGR